LPACSSGIILACALVLHHVRRRALKALIKARTSHGTSSWSVGKKPAAPIPSRVLGLVEALPAGMLARKATGAVMHYRGYQPPLCLLWRPAAGWRPAMRISSGRDVYGALEFQDRVACSTCARLPTHPNLRVSGALPAWPVDFPVFSPLLTPRASAGAPVCVRRGPLSCSGSHFYLFAAQDKTEITGVMKRVIISATNDEYRRD